MKKLQAPNPFFLDANGDALDAGYVFVGTAGANAETNQLTVYWDEAGTQPVAQPLRTANGYIVNGVTRARAFVDADDFSMIVKNRHGVVIDATLTVDDSIISAAMSPVVSATTLAQARTQMGAAQSGANNDITSLGALTSVPSVIASAIGASAPIAGASFRARFYVNTAATTGTFTADQLSVGSNSGQSSILLSGVTVNIDTTTVGAGGMNTGLAPVNGFLALYVIHNPTTSASSIIAIDSTAITVGNTFGYAGLPAGFTHSALVAIVPTNSTRQFKRCFVYGRRVSIDEASALSNGTATIKTSISISSIVPRNAITVDGNFGKGSTGSNASLYADSTGSARKWCGVVSVAGLNMPFSNLPLINTQTIYYDTDGSASVWITGYEF
jgi:hypothetical protein